MTASSYIEGPKSGRLSCFLKKLALALGVTLDVTDVDKGWLNETVFFTVEGTYDELVNFNDCIHKSVAAHNAA